MKPHDEEWKETERELEGRLQMIPSSYDRRKMRGMIQRVRTMDKNKYKILLAQARLEVYKQGSGNIAADVVKLKYQYDKGRLEGQREERERFIGIVKNMKDLGMYAPRIKEKLLNALKEE